MVETPLSRSRATHPQGKRMKEYRNFKRLFPSAACPHPVPCSLTLLPGHPPAAAGVCPHGALAGGPRLPAPPGATPQPRQRAAVRRPGRLPADAVRRRGARGDGRVSELSFHWDVCHGDSTLERRCPWDSFPCRAPMATVLRASQAAKLRPANNASAANRPPVRTVPAYWSPRIPGAARRAQNKLWLWRSTAGASGRRPACCRAVPPR